MYSHLQKHTKRLSHYIQLIRMSLLPKVRVNDLNANPPHFSTGLIGRDNSIARHGIHGLYWLYNIDVQSSWLVEGLNTIFLTQARSTSPFQGIMYDYIRLEAPSDSDSNGSVYPC